MCDCTVIYADILINLVEVGDGMNRQVLGNFEINETCGVFGISLEGGDCVCRKRNMLFLFLKLYI